MIKRRPASELTTQKRVFLVEVTGLEPTTFWSLTRRATKLRYTSVRSNAIIIILKDYKISK